VEVKNRKTVQPEKGDSTAEIARNSKRECLVKPRQITNG
jgi:hypothetical protein